MKRKEVVVCKTEIELPMLTLCTHATTTNNTNNEEKKRKMWKEHNRKEQNSAERRKKGANKEVTTKTKDTHTKNTIITHRIKMSNIILIMAIMHTMEWA